MRDRPARAVRPVDAAESQVGVAEISLAADRAVDDVCRAATGRSVGGRVVVRTDDHVGRAVGVHVASVRDRPAGLVARRLAGQRSGRLRPEVDGAKQPLAGDEIGRSGAVVSEGCADGDPVGTVESAGVRDRPAGPVARRLARQRHVRVGETHPVGHRVAAVDDVGRPGVAGSAVVARCAHDHVCVAVVVHVTRVRHVVAGAVRGRRAGERHVGVGQRDRARIGRTEEDVGRSGVGPAGVVLRCADDEIVDPVTVHVARVRDRPARGVVFGRADVLRVGVREVRLAGETTGC